MFDPCHNQVNDKIGLIVRQGTTTGYAVPFADAASAAGCGCMLRYKDRVVSHRRLLPVVRGKSRGDTGDDESGSMFPYGIESFFKNILPVFVRKPESRPET